MIKLEVSCFDWVEAGNKFFFFATEQNALCSIDRSTEELTVEYVCPGKRANIYNPSKIIECCDRLLFAPFNMEELFIYNPESSSVQTIVFDSEEDRLNGYDVFRTQRFWTYYSFGKCVFLFGRHKAEIMQIDLESMDVSYYDNLDRLIADKGIIDTANNGFFFGNGCVTVGDHIYVAAANCSGIWRMSPDISDLEFVPIDSEIPGFNAIAEYKGNIILTPINKERPDILIWNADDHSSKVIDIGERSIWHKPIICKNDIYLFPGSPGGNVIKVDTSSFVCERSDRLSGTLEPFMDAYFTAVKQIGNKVTFIRSCDSCWLTYDFESDELTEKYYRIEDEEYISGYLKDYYDEVYERERQAGHILSEDVIPFMEYLRRI